MSQPEDTLAFASEDHHQMACVMAFMEDDMAFAKSLADAEHAPLVLDRGSAQKKSSACPGCLGCIPAFFARKWHNKK